MDKLRLPASVSIESFNGDDAVSLLDKDLVLDRDVAESVNRTLAKFEEEYARLIEAAKKNSEKSSKRG
jgi:hypothetical protein